MKHIAIALIIILLFSSFSSAQWSKKKGQDTVYLTVPSDVAKFNEYSKVLPSGEIISPTVTNLRTGTIDSTARLERDKLNKNDAAPMNLRIGYYVLPVRINGIDSLYWGYIYDSVGLDGRHHTVIPDLCVWTLSGATGGGNAMTANEIIAAINNGTLVDIFHHGALGIGGSSSEYFLNWDQTFKIPPMPVVRNFSIKSTEAIAGTTIPLFKATTSMVIDSVLFIARGTTNLGCNIKIADSVNQTTPDSLTSAGMYCNWPNTWQLFKTFISTKDMVATGKEINLKINNVAIAGAFEVQVCGHRVNYTASAPPVLTVTGTLADFGNVTINTTSAEETFSISGSSLSPASGNITVAAPTGFEVSTTSGSGFGTSINVAYMSSTFPSTTVYTHFVPTTAEAYSGNVTISGGGAIQKTVAATGTGASGVLVDNNVIIPLSVPATACSLAYSIAVGNHPNRVLYVPVSNYDSASVNIDSVVYTSYPTRTAFTLVERCVYGTGSGRPHSSAWIFKAPPVGTDSFWIYKHTPSPGYTWGRAISLYNVNQTTPVTDSVWKAEYVSTYPKTSTLTMGGSPSGKLVIDYVGTSSQLGQNISETPGGGQTEFTLYNSTMSCWSSYKTGATTMTHDYAQIGSLIQMALTEIALTFNPY